MKKRLLPIFVILCTFMYINAQPVIELTGKGVAGETTSTLFFDDLSSIEKVVVEAMAVFRDNKTPDSVSFSDADENFTAEFSLAEHDYAPSIPNGSDQSWGYYTATFSTVDIGGISIHKNGQDEEVISFTAYVYRNDGDPSVYNEVIFEHAFVFRNGSANPFIYEFELSETLASRDLLAKIPLSDIASHWTPRYAVVTLSAGSKSVTQEYTENNMGEYLNIAELELKDIPGDITKVYASIYSPTVDENYGDSFITGAVLLSVTEKTGCTLTQGYWKTHSVYGPAKKADPVWELIGPDTEFFLAGDSYIEVLNTAVKGNAYYILAHQYIAAELNFLSGASNTEVIDVFEQATELFNSYTPAMVKNLNSNHSTVKKFKELAGILDDYNNGLIGPGHCGEERNEMQAAAASHSFDAIVNPNPVKNIANIKFKPVMDGEATVELYDMMGNKKESVFTSKVKKDAPVELNLNARPYNEGSYILIIVNGNHKESLKLRITK